mgnify:CR=1 FL=1
MKPDEIKAWARRHGWREDRWGHMKKTVDQKVYRLKFGKRVLRCERRSNLTRQWVRLGSDLSLIHI